jgi:hypothetical protein
MHPVRAKLFPNFGVNRIIIRFCDDQKFFPIFVKESYFGVI